MDKKIVKRGGGDKTMKAEILRLNPLSMQMCVPKKWSDEEVKTFAETEIPCGTSNGWLIRREGHELLNGCPERAQCEKYEDHVHIMLDA